MSGGQNGDGISFTQVQLSYRAPFERPVGESMQTPDPTEESEIIRRLNSIIALLVLNSSKTQRENLLALSNAGLRPIEIANILGRLQHTIRAELSKERRTTQR